MDKEQWGAPKRMVSIWLGAPGRSGPLDIVHPVHPLATPLHHNFILQYVIRMLHIYIQFLIFNIKKQPFWKVDVITIFFTKEKKMFSKYCVHLLIKTLLITRRVSNELEVLYFNNKN